MFVDGPADERIRNALLPVAELVRTWTEEAAVVPWLRLVGCPGHTPGNAIVVVDGGHRRLALIGDLAPITRWSSSTRTGTAAWTGTPRSRPTSAPGGSAASP